MRTASLCVALALSGVASGTVLTFDGTGVLLNNPLSQAYGDRVTATADLVNGFGYGVGNGFTPNVVVNYIGGMDVWNGYSTLDRALGDNAFSVLGEVVLTADEGWLVRLNSLDIAPWTPGQPDVRLTVINESGEVLFDQTYSGRQEIVTAVTFGRTLVGQSLRIRFEDFGDWAMDNVNFDQVTVPGPAAFAAVLVGVAAGTGRRRR